MTVSVGDFTFDFDAALIDVAPGVVLVDCAVLYDACKLAQASVEGIARAPVATAAGLDVLSTDPGTSVVSKTNITVRLLGAWQLRFQPGNYTARISGGNLIGGLGDDPVAYSAGVQTNVYNAASGTAVFLAGTSGLTATEAAQLAQIAQLTAVVAQLSALVQTVKDDTANIEVLL